MGRRRVSNYDDVPERISGETTKSDVTERVFHPNVYPTGLICLSDFERERVEGVDFRNKYWLGCKIYWIANNDDAANQEAYSSLKRSKEQYKKRVIEEVGKYKKNYTVGDDDSNRHGKTNNCNFLNID